MYGVYGINGASNLELLNVFRRHYYNHFHLRNYEKNISSREKLRKRGKKNWKLNSCLTTSEGQNWKKKLNPPIILPCSNN